MARITAVNGFNTYDPASWVGRPTYMDRDQMTIVDGWGNTLRIEGSGLTYWGTQLWGGSVTKIQYFQGEQLRGTIDNFSISAGTVGNFISSGDHAGLMRAVQSGNDIIFDSPYNDRLAGHSGDDTITAGRGNDQVFAGAGNDKITLTGGGNTYVDGGTGFDTVYLPGSGGSYNHAATQGGWQFWNNALNTNLVSIERVVFNDGVRAFDVDGNAGMGFRLYQAAFAREPDAGGLGYWIKALDAGNKLPHSMAADFIYSREFIAKYGTPQTVSNGEYISLLYQNALNRQLDQSGFNYWNQKLSSGEMDRSDLLLYFADSAENRQQTASQVADGIWFA